MEKAENKPKLAALQKVISQEVFAMRSQDLLVTRKGREDSMLSKKRKTGATS